MTSKLKEGVMQGVFTLCACVSILAVALICIFLFANGVPTLFKIGPLKFLLGTTWKPGNDIFGILPMILGSIYVTAGAILVGVPIGLLTAIYMSKFASPRINKVMLPAVQLLAGIPSVVYGFFGMIVLVPAVQAMVKSPFFKTVLHVKSGKGMSLFTAAVLLGIMILPTIITVSKTSLDAVPDSYYEGSLALGATHERSDDLEHRHRDGLRRRPPPRGADRHRRCAVRIHPAYQPLLQPCERGEGLCLRLPQRKQPPI